MITLDWHDIEDLVTILADGISDNFEDIKYIHGLSRGGLIPAVMLSHKLNIPLTNTPHFYGSWQVLIVDDIADSGHTLKQWKAEDFQTAVLHYKPHTSAVTPDIWSVEHKKDDWIIYPWEQPEAETIQDYKLDK